MSLLRSPAKTTRIDFECTTTPKTPANDRSQAFSASSRRQRWFDTRCLCRRTVLNRLSKIQQGQLTFVDRTAAYEFGQVGDTGLTGIITVHDPRFYYFTISGGSLGAAEAYLHGHWDSHDLTSAMRILCRNATAISAFEKGLPRVLKPIRKLKNSLLRNTRRGSKRNIAAHYDLSNEFFALMLDPTMTYSSGIFPYENATLEEASLEKYDRICQKLKLQADDHVLEIGTGWGGFAEYAASNYGCRVTTTTISDKQQAYAKRRFRDRSLEDRIHLLKRDYRDLQGKFDKLVSIEMIEAVGEKYLPGFFAKCSSLLKPKGTMLLQAITMPDDRYESYRHSVDFIRKYIFPGGFLPSLGAMAESAGKHAGLRFIQFEDLSAHYAQTLAAWRNNFWNQIESIRSLGFDFRFIRMWHFYLCYCEAAFLEQQTGVSQIVLSKPS